MTTNAMLLEKYAEQILEAGVTHLNISLDSLQRTRFHKITGRDAYDTVINGINKALELDFKSVKLNMVVIAGVNDDEVLDFVDFFQDKNINVRFIEFMPFKNNDWQIDKVITYKQMLETISSKFKLQEITTKPSAVAKDFSVEGKNISVSFVTSMSESFCSTCDRVRLTSDGSIKSCLFNPAEVNIREALRQNQSDGAIKEMIQYAIGQKPEAHLPAEEIAREENRSMIQIGG